MTNAKSPILGKIAEMLNGDPGQHSTTEWYEIAKDKNVDVFVRGVNLNELVVLDGTLSKQVRLVASSADLENLHDARDVLVGYETFGVEPQKLRFSAKSLPHFQVALFKAVFKGARRQGSQNVDVDPSVWGSRLAKVSDADMVRVILMPINLGNRDLMPKLALEATSDAPEFTLTEWKQPETEKLSWPQEQINEYLSPLIHAAKAHEAVQLVLGVSEDGHAIGMFSELPDILTINTMFPPIPESSFSAKVTEIIPPREMRWKRSNCWDAIATVNKSRGREWLIRDCEAEGNPVIGVTINAMENTSEATEATVAMEAEIALPNSRYLMSVEVRNLDPRMEGTYLPEFVRPVSSMGAWMRLSGAGSRFIKLLKSQSAYVRFYIGPEPRVEKLGRNLFDLVIVSSEITPDTIQEVEDVCHWGKCGTPKLVVVNHKFVGVYERLRKLIGHDNSAWFIIWEVPLSVRLADLSNDLRAFRSDSLLGFVPEEITWTRSPSAEGDVKDSELMPFADILELVPDESDPVFSTLPEISRIKAATWLLPTAQGFCRVPGWDTVAAGLVASTSLAKDITNAVKRCLDCRGNLGQVLVKQKLRHTGLTASLRCSALQLRRMGFLVIWMEKPLDSSKDWTKLSEVLGEAARTGLVVFTDHGDKDVCLQQLLSTLAQRRVTNRVCLVSGLRSDIDCGLRPFLEVPINWKEEDLIAYAQILVDHIPLCDPKTGLELSTEHKQKAKDELEKAHWEDGITPSLCLLLLTIVEGRYATSQRWIRDQVIVANNLGDAESEALLALAFVSATTSDPKFRHLPVNLNGNYSLLTKSRKQKVKYAQFMHPLLAVLHLNLVADLPPSLDLPGLPVLLVQWKRTATLLAKLLGKDEVYPHVRDILQGMDPDFSEIAKHALIRNDIENYRDFIRYPEAHPLESPHDHILMSRLFLEVSEFQRAVQEAEMARRRTKRSPSGRPLTPQEVLTISRHAHALKCWALSENLSDKARDAISLYRQVEPVVNGWERKCQPLLDRFGELILGTDADIPGEGGWNTQNNYNLQNSQGSRFSFA